MTLRRLASLLPDVDATSLLGSVLGDLHRMEPELLALKVRNVLLEVQIAQLLD